MIKMSNKQVIGICSDKVMRNGVRCVTFDRAEDDIADMIQLYQDTDGTWSDDGYTSFELMIMDNKEANELLERVAKVWGIKYKDEELITNEKDPTHLLQAMSYVFTKIRLDRYSPSPVKV